MSLILSKLNCLTFYFYSLCAFIYVFKYKSTVLTNHLHNFYVHFCQQNNQKLVNTLTFTSAKRRYFFCVLKYYKKHLFNGIDTQFNGSLHLVYNKCFECYINVCVNYVKKFSHIFLRWT